MKKLTSTLAIIAAMGMASSPAMAGDTVTKTLTIGGNVADTVSIPNDPVAVGTPSNSSFVGGTGAISITALAATDLTPNSAGIIVKYADVSTNYLTTIKLTSTNQGLTNPSEATPPAGFTKKVNYTAVASQENGGADVASLDTSTGYEVESAQLQPFSDNIAINITVPNTASTDKLVPGDYSDTLTLEISPPT
jgi:hypothetical protein